MPHTYGPNRNNWREPAYESDYAAEAAEHFKAQTDTVRQPEVALDQNDWFKLEWSWTGEDDWFNVGAHTFGTVEAAAAELRRLPKNGHQGEIAYRIIRVVQFEYEVRL